MVKTNDDGSKSLAEIHFGGKKYALAIGQETAAWMAAAVTASKVDRGEKKKGSVSSSPF